MLYKHIWDNVGFFLSLVLFLLALHERSYLKKTLFESTIAFGVQAVHSELGYTGSELFRHEPVESLAGKQSNVNQVPVDQVVMLLFLHFLESLHWEEALCSTLKCEQKLARRVGWQVGLENISKVVLHLQCAQITAS